MKERIILLVDMDAFFASCEQASDPRLKGKPVIVCGSPKKRSVVAACSYEAKAFGIQNGMSVFKALALCPQAVLVPGHMDRYVAVAGRIFRSLERWTPLVEVVSIDEAFLDVTDTWSRFSAKIVGGSADLCGGGSPETIAQRIRQEVQDRHRLSCTVGIGPNKLLAKLAARLNKPAGIGRIHPDEIPGCLERLPVESLSGIGPHLTLALSQMGVTTLGELARVPVGNLTQRFKFYGQLLHRMALGIDESPVLPADAPEVVRSMGHAYTLDRDTRDPILIRGTLLKLSEKVGRRLRAGGYWGRTVSVTVRFSDFTTFHRQRTVGEFFNEGQAIHRVACRLVEEAGTIRPIRLLGVAVSNLRRFKDLPDLWEDRCRSRRLIEALDRINDTFGEETITWAGTYVPFVEKARGFFGHRWYKEYAL